MPDPHFAEGIGLKSCFLAAVLILAAIAIQPATAQTESVLYSFSGQPDGSGPYAAGLVRDAKGNVYGVTGAGGTYNYGTVFVVTPAGTEKVLYSFSGGPADGAYPTDNLLRDKLGNLYGTTTYGGAANFGTVFELAYSKPTKTYTEKVLYSFGGTPDGAVPEGALIQDKPGNLYGTTSRGGTYTTCSGPSGTGCGTVFELDKGGVETTLYDFTGGTDGATPATGSLLRDSKGNLYGLSYYGGAYGCGTAYEITSASTSVLHTFTDGQDGGYPWAGPLVRDSKGNLYGVTEWGGAYNGGTVFELVYSPKTKTYSENVLYNFTGGADGYQPLAGLVRDVAGNLYGTTVYGGSYGYGTVFEISPTGSESVLYSFTGGVDGGMPWAGLVRDKGGNLYGTTVAGGNPNCSGGCGVVFKVTP